MRWASKLFSCLLICLTSIPAIAQEAQTKEADQPQMVWLNHAEGEVKFSPGHKGEPVLGKDWIEANTGQVVEDGYTLATEKGRAEIEFENGTVVYLAENSVLVFNSLWATEGATETRLNLLTGRATIAHVTRDVTHVETPVVAMSFAGTQTARFESTLDGVVIHAVEGDLPLVGGPSGITTLKSGGSAASVGGRVIPLKETEQTREGEEWDRWVADRLTERRALVAQGLKEAGLTEPIPGLAGMVKNGKFSDCAPYGKCWEPNQVAEQAGAQAAPGATGNSQTTAGTKRRQIVVNNTMLNRCPLETWMASTTGVGSVVEYGTCFAGSWAHRRWVAGRHHRHSCHFVKVKHGIGIVPRHPLDVKGKPPINAKSGILVLVAQKGKLQAGVQPTPSKGIQLRANPPSGPERGLMGSAPRVAPPVIQARLAEAMLPHDALGIVRTGEQKNLTDIRYDYKSQAFVSHAGGGNVHAGVAHVGSGATDTANVQLGGHGSTVGSGGSHVSNGSSNGGSHGSAGGNGGAGHSGGTSSSATSSAASSSAASHH
jgi:hypothetical protein